MSATDTAETTPEPPVLTEQQSAPPPKRGGGFTLFVALLAFLLGGAACGWLGYQFWLQHQGSPAQKPWREDLVSAGENLRQELATAQQDAFARLRQQLTTQDKELRETLKQQQLVLENSLQQQEQRLNQTAVQLTATQERLNEAVRLNRDDWILAEAEYLLRLAHQRAQLGGDLTPVNDLLLDVQRKLRTTQDSRTDAVLTVLARDLEHVKDILAFDVGALQDELDSINAAAIALQPLADRKVRAKPIAPAPEPPPELAWDTVWPIIKYGFARAAEKLDSYIRVSDRDASYQESVIAGGQRELFQENLQLMFEQAQWALTSGNQDLFRKALARCSDWLRRYYRNGEAEQAVLADIEHLSQKTIRPANPPLTASIAALAALIDQRREGEAQP
ncbi:uroporphyrinogen-III C-methyltransferase [Litorivivens sp.]|uniref:uroporphyrinogen-III C-methyltransferase n=1 Tax=Litorivivens sp. TaxID=2020868 RepID=UPI00356376C1